VFASGHARASPAFPARSAAQRLDGGPFDVIRPDAARIYAVLMITALGVSLLSARAPTDVSVWVTISAMVRVAVAILSGLNAGLRAEAHTGGLTGPLNRTGFAVAAARLRGCAMALRRGELLALAVIDLDDVKVVNYRGGHAAGDRLLVELAGGLDCSAAAGRLVGTLRRRRVRPDARGGQRKIRYDNLLARLARAHPASCDGGRRALPGRGVTRRAIERADAGLYVAKEPRRNAFDRDRQATPRAAVSTRPRLTARLRGHGHRVAAQRLSSAAGLGAPPRS
jgi:GGDEF domain-containing protein